MKCELCGAQEATVVLKHVAGGEVQEVHVCGKCAAAKGVDVSVPIPRLVDLLCGGGADRQPLPATANKTCPVCHMRRSHFKKTSLLGCPTCYETFPEDITPFLEGLPGGCAHVGKVPAREKAAAETALLERRLREAVRAQHYEEAAQLRDRLRDVKVYGGQKVRSDA